MTEERYEFTVAPEEEGRRLDAYLAPEAAGLLQIIPTEEY